MKKLFAVLAALSAFLMSGCTKYQSSFNINDLKSNITIVGRVKYYPGYELDESGRPYEMDARAVSSAEVTVIVPNSSYSSSASGYHSFKTKTNFDGSFSINIPAIEGRSVSGVRVEVKYNSVYNSSVYDSEKKTYSIKKLYDTMFYDYSTTTMSYNMPNIVALYLRPYTY